MSIGFKSSGMTRGIHRTRTNSEKYNRLKPTTFLQRVAQRMAPSNRTMTRACRHSLLNSFGQLQLIIILLLCPILTIAAEPATLNSEIAAIESTYKSLNDLSAKFVQTTDIALVERTVTKHGMFQFKKGGKLKITYDGKDGKQYISDGETLWTYIPGDAASMQTFALNDKSVPKEALSFLSGFGQLSKEFKVSESSAFTEIPNGFSALHLVPLGKSPQYKSLDALFAANHLISEMIVKNTSGNVSRYKFSEIKTNAGLSDNIFTFSSGKATPDTLPQ